MRQVLLIADTGEARVASSAALAAAGIEDPVEASTADAPAALVAATRFDMIVIEAAGVDQERLELLLEQTRALGVPMMVTLAEAQLDLGVSLLLGTGARLLCGPSHAERLEAIASARPLAFETVRADSTLREPARAYHGPEQVIGAAEVRATIRARQMRSQFFAGDLFADPAWDMLLDLFAASLERRQVSVSSLCIAAAVPPTTALRWIGSLHDAGLFERHADPSDRRRAYIALSQKALDGMRGYVSAVKRAGLSLV
jgi:hypothetical protein